VLLLMQGVLQVVRLVMCVWAAHRCRWCVDTESARCCSTTQLSCCCVLLLWVAPRAGDRQWVVSVGSLD
jgi:hypothetical protein